MGDDLAFLDLTGGAAISDVIANMRRLDRDLLEASVLRHRSGVHVIAQTEKMEEAAQIEAASLTNLIHFLRQHYKAVILDGLRTFDDHTVAALDAADQIILVVTQEVPAVRRAHRCVSFLHRLGHDDGRVKLIVNRHAKSAEIADELLSETVGLPIAATLSSDYPSLVRAINRGLLLLDAAPRSTLTKDVERLQALLGPPAPQEQKRSLLKRLFTKAAAHAG
jgi:pilus assembly protein CpaE